MTANNDELKVQLFPCPFCGGKPMAGSSYDEDILLHNIRCRCGAGVNDFFGPEEAIDAWNTRANEAKGTVKENLTVGSGKAVAGCLLVRGELRDPFLAKDVIDPALWDEPNIVKLYTSPRATAEDVSDAERYRWLRMRYRSMSPHMDGTMQYCMPMMELRGRSFDDAIDQAIAKGREVGNG